MIDPMNDNKATGRSSEFFHPSTFEYHKPNDNEISDMAVARQATREYARILHEILPDGPDKTYIMRKIRECGMWANVAITRRSDGTPWEDVTAFDKD